MDLCESAGYLAKCAILPISGVPHPFSALESVAGGLLLTGIVAFCPAAELPADARVGDKTESYLRQRVEIWKERLKLQGWSVSLVVSQQSELTGHVG